MNKKVTTYDKLKNTFDVMGIELVQRDGLCEFEYENMPYLLGIFEDEQLFYLTQIVFGFDDEPLSKAVFDTALEVAQSQHPDLDGQWQEECPWVSSPLYTLKGVSRLSKKDMEQILKDFNEAAWFMQANIYLMTDPSIWKDQKEEQPCK